METATQETREIRLLNVDHRFVSTQANMTSSSSLQNTLRIICGLCLFLGVNHVRRHRSPKRKIKWFTSRNEMIFCELFDHNQKRSRMKINWTIPPFFHFQLCEERMCQEEVSILAINYMDRVLNKLPISKNNLQLLAATCTFLASKLREPSTHALQPEVLIYYTDNSITKRDLMVSRAIQIICSFDETTTQRDDRMECLNWIAA